MSLPASDEEDFRTILGVRFFVGGADEAVARGMQGGLVVVPSAPVLMTMVDDVATREALLQSKLALSDSGLMVLVWNFLKRDHVRRVSGLEYIKALVDQPEFRAPDASFWIMPHEEALEKTLRWLEQRGDRVTRDACYLAPMYGGGRVSDPELLRLLEVRCPRHIVIAVGGGVQERLGAYLQAHTDFNPAIHCIGAAIGFLSGAQVHIPMWADRWRLGWLFRCLSAPRTFVPRYWNARKLVGLMLRYGARMPDSAKI
jgi:N-acetylglucosaminyldiphosphoundecaprenol N-acetyl-beta-D-mannosaminyltransferase